MIASFRKTFFPTTEETIEYLELILSLHEKFRGDCVTCTSYVDSNMPGFVTDYGTCKKHYRSFYKKVCGLSNEPCPLYEEDLETAEKIRKTIAELKGEN